MKIKYRESDTLGGGCGCAAMIIALAIALDFQQVLDLIRFIFSK